MPESANAALGALVDAVNELGAGNPWDVAGLGESLREFVDDLAQEAARFPQTLEKAQWDLVAIDENRDDAAFIVVVLSSERVALLAGRGALEAVRDHGENFACDDAFDVIGATRAKFVTTAPLELSRAAFDRWLADM